MTEGVKVPISRRKLAALRTFVVGSLVAYLSLVVFILVCRVMGYEPFGFMVERGTLTGVFLIVAFIWAIHKDNWRRVWYAKG